MANPGPSPSLNIMIRDYFKAPGTLAHASSWISKSEIPSAEEVLGLDNTSNSSDTHGSNPPSDAVALPVNKVVGMWVDKEEYLGAHYELLREDVVGPFCEAVQDYRDNRGGENDRYCVYEKVMLRLVFSVIAAGNSLQVHVKGFILSPKGIATRVTFSTKRAGKRIIWEQSKRLISGTLVALSPSKDAFKTTCVVAVVAARPLEGVNQLPPEVDLFLKADDQEIDPQREWVMVESKVGYFEANRHTLTALQKVMRERFVLGRCCF